MNHTKRTRIIQIIVIIGIVVIFVVLNMLINMKRLKRPIEYCSGNEFVRTIDLATIIDSNYGKKLLISFDAKAEKPGTIKVYQQNGVSSKYYFSEDIDVGVEYSHYEMIVSPILSNESDYESYLAFYGVYGTGVVPTVSSIDVQVYE